jgi:hypothetical protein
MIRRKLIEVLELEVSSAEAGPLIFRVEILAEISGRKRVFRGRLFRLEQLRFRTGAKRGPREADYRCWVVDDNLGIEDASYRSITAARAGVLRVLGQQLGTR